MFPQTPKKSLTGIIIFTWKLECDALAAFSGKRVWQTWFYCIIFLASPERKGNWLPKIAIYQRKKNLIIKTDWVNSILREEFPHQVAYCTRWYQRCLVAEFLDYLQSSENHAFHDIVLGAHTSPLLPPFSYSCSSYPIPYHSGLRLLHVTARLSIFLIPFISAHTSKYHPFFW